VNVSVSVMDEPAGDQLRELRRLLGAEEELRGQVRLVERSPREGELGRLVEAVLVNLGPGGAAAFASVLISWIRHRTGAARGGAATRRQRWRFPRRGRAVWMPRSCGRWWNSYRSRWATPQHPDSEHPAGDSSELLDGRRELKPVNTRTTTWSSRPALPRVVAKVYAS
jgi:hypothetical protein